MNSTIENVGPDLLASFDSNTTDQVNKFHNSLPNYRPTPLVKLSRLANYLDVKEILVKDESQRFDLNAFKVLGASFAIAKYLGKLLGLSCDELTFDRIIAEQSQFKQVTFVTATDGNHGRAVAWSAKLFGCQSVVYMPKGSSQARLEAISKYGASASITTLNYDETVLYADTKSQQEGWILVQDTSWQGYQEVPLHIMQGYCGLVTECLRQEPTFSPTHVFLQAGVGSLAAAILACMFNLPNQPQPKFILVEPQAAPCFFESNKRNKRFTVKGDLSTIMAGLACGEPSHLAWEILKPTASGFIVCSDDIARKGMRILADPIQGDQNVISGESGAVTLGAVFEILSNEEFGEIRKLLKFTSDSKIFLISSEGDTDPDVYRDILSEPEPLYEN